MSASSLMNLSSWSGWRNHTTFSIACCTDINRAQGPAGPKGREGSRAGRSQRPGRPKGREGPRAGAKGSL
eukprot:11013851-Karenia_brevis.AAC.1